ncbi:DUF5655 domain-containing protein [Chloroflexota bacterium]
MSMLKHKKVLLFTLIVVLLAAVACESSGDVGGGTGGNGEDQQQLPAQDPIDDQEPQEPAPTQPPPEPEPTQAPPQQQPPQQEPPQPETTQAPDTGSSEDLIKALLIILVLVIALGAFIWIISLFTGSRGKKAEPAPIPVQEQQPSVPVTENTLLKNASPEVTNLYNRFVDLVKAIGPVSILPTQTRIDFQARTIFASVYFKLESLEIQLVLPTIVQEARIIRVDTIGTDKYAHNIMIDSLDDYDARFNTWLQEAYELGS